MNDDSLTIIRPKTRAEHPDPWADVPFEPAFFSPGTRLLPSLPVTGWRQRYAEHLGFHVTARNRDLLAHVRRVLLWAAAGNRQAAYRALADLFQVLGTKGLELRKDILQRVAPVLSPTQVSSLRAQLAVTETVTSMFDLPTSRFAPKRSAKLVTLGARAHRTEVGARGPLGEAREYLENGQVEEARKVLEAALPLHAHDTDMHRELLEIYRRARDLDGCQSMYSKIDVKDSAVEKDWLDTLSLLEGCAAGR
ncbi:MAG: hypothetical protein R3F45_13505 [Gammaproteobacteria bacterium]